MKGFALINLSRVRTEKAKSMPTLDSHIVVVASAGRIGLFAMPDREGPKRQAKHIIQSSTTLEKFF